MKRCLADSNNRLLSYCPRLSQSGIIKTGNHIGIKIAIGNDIKYSRNGGIAIFRALNRRWCLMVGNRFNMIIFGKLGDK